MIAALPVNNEALTKGLPNISFINTYQLRRNGIDYWDFPVENYISHDSVGLLGYKFFDKFLDPEFEYMVDNTELYSTSIGPACNYYIIENGVYKALSPILNPNKLQAIAEHRINIIRNLHPNLVLSFENTAYRKGNEAYLYITQPSFINKLVNDNDVYFTLDLAHALVTAKSLDIAIKDYLDLLPLDKCVEVHLSGPDGLEDTHNLPTNEIMALFKYVIPKIIPDAYVVVEYYKDMNKLKDFYETVLKGYISD
jgi:hypothetical protein